MTKFVPWHLHLSHGQRHKLARGERVQLKHEHLGGPAHSLHSPGSGHTLVHITPTQARQIHSRHRKHGGLRLQFSHTQLRHNLRSGSGIFSSLGKALGSAAKTVAKHGVNAAKVLGRTAVQEGKNLYHAAKKVDWAKHAQTAAQLAEQSGLLDLAKQHAREVAVNKVNHYAEKLAGKGKVGNILAQAGSNLAHAAIEQHLGPAPPEFVGEPQEGGRVRRRKGYGVMAPGGGVRAPGGRIHRRGGSGLFDWLF